MKNFYMKYKNIISMIMDITLIILGFYRKNFIFIILGLLLLLLTFYVCKIEREDAKEKARIQAEKKALKDEQKRLNKGKKKKKSKKR